MKSLQTVMKRIALTAAILLFGFYTHTAHAQATPATARLILRNAKFFTMAPNQKEVFSGYMVVDSMGKISAIGAGEPPAGLKAVQTWDAGGHWVTPGFLSAHSHLWQAAFRGIAADKTLLDWITGLYLNKAVNAQAEDFYWFTLSGALDHLQHGITGAYDFTYGGSSRGNCQGIECDKSSYQADVDSGFRFVYGYQPDQIRESDNAEMAMARLQQFEDWLKSQPDSPQLLSVMINGMTSFNTTYQQSVAEKAMMDKFHVGNQSHFLEPPEHVAADQEKFKWYVDSGLLGSKDLYFGHFIHTSDAILEATAKAHGGMSWNPLSNGRLASGTADIPKYLKMGIRVGMGVDGEASADLADPFENMRTGMYAIRDKYEDATIMSPYQVLYLHTMGSADVMGVKDKLGSLEVGKYADFLVIDPTRFGTVFDPYASLVLITGERDLERVYVGGVLKVEHGRMLGQDMGKVQQETNRRSAATMKAATGSTVQ
jgi:5-methylthioadenosine/S-adenosylhomocysteine deaminase